MSPVLWKYFESANDADIASTFQDWRKQQPGLGILALVSEHGADAAVASLQTAANMAALPLAGAVVPGLIIEGHFCRNGVLLLALDSKVQQTIVPLRRDGKSPDETAAIDLAAFVETHADIDGADTLLLFFDALTPNIASLLDNLYLAVGDRVRYAGSNAGSETFKPVHCLFNNTTFIQDGVLALLLPKHPGAALAHRYCGTAPLCIATGASGNRIDSIDGQPAFDRYRKLVADAHGVELTRENFYQHAVRYPLALHLADGEDLVRIAVAVQDDGSLYCVGEVPQSALLSVLEAAPRGNAETAQEVAAAVRAHNPATVLAFYCAGRLLFQGKEAAAKELAALTEAFAPATLFGALSLGEVGNARNGGYPRFHNATIVGLPWP